MSTTEWNGMRDILVKKYNINENCYHILNGVLNKIRHRSADNTTYKIAEVVLRMEIDIWSGKSF
jgi:hypothetical protein